MEKYKNEVSAEVFLGVINLVLIEIINNSSKGDNQEKIKNKTYSKIETLSSPAPSVFIGH